MWRDTEHHALSCYAGLSYQVLPRPGSGPGHRRRSACSSSLRIQARKRAFHGGGGRPAQHGMHCVGVGSRTAHQCMHLPGSRAQHWDRLDGIIVRRPVQWHNEVRRSLTIILQRASAGMLSLTAALRLLRTASTKGRLSMRVPGMRRPCQNACAGRHVLQQSVAGGGRLTRPCVDEYYPDVANGAPRRAVLDVQPSALRRVHVQVRRQPLLYTRQRESRQSGPVDSASMSSRDDTAACDSSRAACDCVGCCVMVKVWTGCFLADSSTTGSVSLPLLYG